MKANIFMQYMIKSFSWWVEGNNGFPSRFQMDFRCVEIMFKKEGEKSLNYPRIPVICILMHNSCSSPDITLPQSDSLMYKNEYLENAECCMKWSSIYILSGKIFKH